MRAWPSRTAAKSGKATRTASGDGPKMLPDQPRGQRLDVDGGPGGHRSNAAAASQPTASRWSPKASAAPGAKA